MSFCSCQTPRTAMVKKQGSPGNTQRETSTGEEVEEDSALNPNSLPFPTLQMRPKFPRQGSGSVSCRGKFGLFAEREANITKEQIEKILKAGANVILATKGIDDMALKRPLSIVLWMHYFVEAKAIALRRVSKEDMRHVAKATGASQVSIVVRGASDYMLDEMERSIHDSLSIVKRTLESNTGSGSRRGAGAVEAALSVYLENLASGNCFGFTRATCYS